MSVAWTTDHQRPPRRLEHLGGLELGGRIISSFEALTLDRVPVSAIVLGGGVIGVEFASVWRSFGSEVTIVEALPRLVAAEEPEVSAALERAFRTRGISVRTGVRFEGATTLDGTVVVRLSGGESLEADVLLVAPDFVAGAPDGASLQRGRGAV